VLNEINFDDWTDEDYIEHISRDIDVIELEDGTKECRINEILTLKLEGNSVTIYVKGVRFDQCKFLLINIPSLEIKEYRKVDSIDEAEDVFSELSTDRYIEDLDKSMEGGGRHIIDISVETEFWGHCSNIHTWYEYEYDTRLIHRNLAFPLLKRLYQAGDKIALKRFKEEIILRLKSGYKSVVDFLIEEKYLECFTADELEVMANDFNCVHVMDYIYYLRNKVSYDDIEEENF
jgi:hypothetical protein